MGSKGVVTLGVIFLAAAGILASADTVWISQSHWLANYLPEMVGLCLEGVVFVVILDSLQRRNEKRRRKRLQDSLLLELSFLAIVIQNRLLQSKLGELPGEIDFSTNGTIADSMDNLRLKWEKKRIARGSPAGKSDGFSDLAVSLADSVREKSEVHLQRLRYVSPVAADFGADFLTDWFSLMDSLYQLTQREQRQASTKQTFDPHKEAETAYGSTIKLFHQLHKLDVPPYQSCQIS